MQNEQMQKFNEAIFEDRFPNINVLKPLIHATAEFPNELGIFEWNEFHNEPHKSEWKKFGNEPKYLNEMSFTMILDYLNKISFMNEL